MKNLVFLIGEEILRNADNDTSGDYAPGGYAACHYAASGYAACHYAAGCYVACHYAAGGYAVGVYAAGGYATGGYAACGYAAAYAFVILKENTRNAGLHIT
jgi:hypothetical protein